MNSQCDIGKVTSSLCLSFFTCKDGTFILYFKGLLWDHIKLFMQSQAYSRCLRNTHSGVLGNRAPESIRGTYQPSSKLLSGSADSGCDKLDPPDYFVCSLHYMEIPVVT